MLKDHILYSIALTPDFPYKDLCSVAIKLFGWVLRVRLLVCWWPSHSGGWDSAFVTSCNKACRLVSLSINALPFSFILLEPTLMLVSRTPSWMSMLQDTHLVHCAFGLREQSDGQFWPENEDTTLIKKKKRPNFPIRTRSLISWCHFILLLKMLFWFDFL